MLQEQVLLIGDRQRDVHAAVVQAVPGAQVTAVPTLFDGIAELSNARFTTVLAAAEPLERRPEAAVRTLRQLAGQARVLLFGHPTLEILSRKMLEFGCDDYVITPASLSEFQQIFASPSLRIAPAEVAEPQPADSTQPAASPLVDLPLADIVLDAAVTSPHESLVAAVQQINTRIAPAFELQFTLRNQPTPVTADGRLVLSHSVRNGTEEPGIVHLLTPAAHDPAAARHALAQIAHMLGKAVTLQERHNRLQKLAITDELTGLYNSRYFRHFLSTILERARKMHFPVTLLLFDIDDFKKYNDQFGHATGDDILKQASALMRRCVRQHDLVARIGGDEFAVVFWDKDGPRQPREPKTGGSYRPPNEPVQIFERFRGLLSSEDFPLLGQTGKGQLTVSGGLAVFPWDAQNTEGLIEEADRRLMMGAKKHGKNTIYIVGTDEPMGKRPGGQ
jgi:GGDEF domain-containing protein